MATLLGRPLQRPTIMQRKGPMLLVASMAALALVDWAMTEAAFVGWSTSGQERSLCGPSPFEVPTVAMASEKLKKGLVRVWTPPEPGLPLEPADPTWQSGAKFPCYEGFVFNRKRLPQLRLRLDRYGTGKQPFYRIKATIAARKNPQCGRFLEQIGWWNPLLPFDHPHFFKLKADRAMYWLRRGCEPTDQVATLLDLAGLIRRTGPWSKRGEWEWRVPKDSGPEAPEGWKFEGPQQVTWNNMPMRKAYKNKRSKSKSALLKLPLIERFGFRGYEKIPMDFNVLTEPVTRSSLLEAFPNTDLPMY